jgi:hypothetical protein
MFTAGACFLVALLVWLARRTNKKDQPDYDRNAPDERSQWLLMLHIRQDLKDCVLVGWRHGPAGHPSGPTVLVVSVCLRLIGSDGTISDRTHCVRLTSRFLLRKLRGYCNCNIGLLEGAGRGAGLRGIGPKSPIWPYLMALCCDA